MKSIIWIAFAIMVAAQLWVPTSMIFAKEKVIKNGTAFKFRCAPVDPANVFKGRYIVLRYNINQMKIADTTGMSDSYYNQPVFVSLTTDSLGFAKIDNVQMEAPESGHYVAATANARLYSTPPSWFINYPFTQFYMEEYKAPIAESIYNKNNRRDSSNVTYALVKVLDGDAVIEDVIINEESIIELSRQQLELNKLNN